jgi:hypothetical protein
MRPPASASPAPASAAGPSLHERLAELGRRIGAREASHRQALAEARRRAEDLHRRVAAALEAFHAGVSESGAEPIGIGIGPVRGDDKHIRAVEFELTRGRYRAIVTVKSRGEVMLVGPFKSGGAEGPCATFPFDASHELEAALASFLERFLEEGATP